MYSICTTDSRDDRSGQQLSSHVPDGDLPVRSEKC